MSNVAILRAGIEGDDTTLYRLEIKGTATELRGRTVPGVESSSFATPRLPREIERRLRQWAMADSDFRTVCVACEGEPLTALAWEALPRSLGLDRLAIARLSGAGAPLPARLPSTAMLLGGWSEHRGRSLPGIARELTELGKSLADARLALRVLPEPTVDELKKACDDAAPVIVHLAHPGVMRSSADLRLLVPGDRSEPHGLTPGELGDLLSTPNLRLLVLNAGHGGLSMARALGRRLGAIVVGWTGGVTDELAADFSFFFYQRLLEGSSVVAAIHRFHERGHLGGGAPPGAGPAVWLPSPEAVGWSLAENARSMDRTLAEGTTRGGVRSADAGVRTRWRDGGAKVSIAFEPLAAVNPALLRNGRPLIERLSVESSEALEGVRLQIECETGSGSSCFRQTLDLAKGLQPISSDGVQFPVLYQLIAQRAERRYINFVVSIHGREGLLVETTRSVLWMGQTEWMDQPDTWAFIPAFVQPNSKGVLRIFDRAVDVLRMTGKPSDSFCGYQEQEDDAESVRRQMRAVFVTLRDNPFGLKYINPLGSPVYLPGAAAPRGQLVRSPDEVIEHRRGTCHDLALLFAACAEHVGIHPLVILIPGHTFFGFWTSSRDHQKFWAAVHSDMSRASRFGGRWVIDAPEEIEMLTREGSVELVESTLVTQGQETYEQACAVAQRRLQTMRSTGLDAVVDVWASRHVVQPVQG